MAKSRLEAQVFYNKSEVVAQLSRGKSVRDLQRPEDSAPFARVYSNKSGPFQERVIVSVNGAMMFERLVRHAPQIVVDLDPSRARQVQIGRAHVQTPVTNAHLVCRLML